MLTAILRVFECWTSLKEGQKKKQQNTRTNSAKYELAMYIACGKCQGMKPLELVLKTLVTNVQTAQMHGGVGRGSILIAPPPHPKKQITSLSHDW